MKILILDDFFNCSDYYKMGQLKNKNLINYKAYKLNKLIKKLKNSCREEIKFKIISASSSKFFLNKEIRVDLLSDIRINLDHEKFLLIKHKIIKNTGKILSQFIQNTRKLKIFNINGIVIGKTIEAYLAIFLNESFGELELLKEILSIEVYDKIIFFNVNSYFLDFLKKASYLKVKNIETCHDFLLILAKKLSIGLKYRIYFPLSLHGLKYKIRLFFVEYFQRKKMINLPDKTYMLFVTNTLNQLKSIEPIYEAFKKKEDFFPIYYKNHPYFYHLEKCGDLIRNILNLRKIWKNSSEILLGNLEYDSIKLKNIFNYFYKTHLLFFSIGIYINSYYFQEFIKKRKPSIVIQAEELSIEGRMYNILCKKNKIPSLYIPHASIPIYDELGIKTDFDYIAVPGNVGKDYLIKRGESKEGVILTGRPRYADFYYGKIKSLTDVKDMFSTRVYRFSKKKISILFATNPMDEKSIEIQVFNVIKTLEELNLLDQLIIKLHPRENGIIYKRIFKELDVNPIIVRDYNIFELIQSCDILFARISNVILEAMIIGTPIILLDLINTSFYLTGYYLFCNENYVMIASNRQSLKEIIDKLMNNKAFYMNYSKKLKNSAKNFSFYDKNSIRNEIIVSLIEKILKDKIM